MAGQVQCVDCAKTSPAAMGEVTLTSTIGWRLARHLQPDGTYTIEWRCPECWARYKARRSSLPSPGMPMPEDFARKKP